MAQNQYIKRENFDWILQDLNFESCDEPKKKEILDRATGDLEADLSRKFIVPLIERFGGGYTATPQFAQMKVLNALKAKIKEVIGFDKNRTLTGTIDSTEKFINVHGIEYKDQIKGLLDPMIDYKFKLLNQAEESQTPVQHLGLARANNSTDPYGGGYGGGLY
jgi:hypothetical protein